jgi:nickel/cobalt exporter
MLAHTVHVPSLATWGEQLAGAGLLATALLSLRSLRATRAATSHDHKHAPARSPLWVGLVHGLTGAGSLVLVLPVIVSGSVERALAFLFAFALGSTFAMATLTGVIARVSAALSRRTIEHAQLALALGALGLGMHWLMT